MRSSGSKLKIAVVASLVLVIFFMAGREATSALVDWVKHEEWRRKQLAALIEEVKLKGAMPYVIMSFRNYDLNKDGVIDENEIEPIEDYLKQPAATRPGK